MLPLALITVELFKPRAGKLELDLGFLAGKTWTLGNVPLILLISVRWSLSLCAL